MPGQRPPPPSYQPPSLHGKHPAVSHAASTTNFPLAPQPSYSQRRPSAESRSAKSPGTSESLSAEPTPSSTPVSPPTPSSSSNSNSVSMTLSLPTTTPSSSQSSSPRSPGRQILTDQRIKVFGWRFMCRANLIRPIRLAVLSETSRSSRGIISHPVFLTLPGLMPHAPPSYRPGWRLTMQMPQLQLARLANCCVRHNSLEL